MKLLTAFLTLLFYAGALAQGHHASFSAIDWKVQSIDANSPDSLARLLTAEYTADREKARAVFSWITQHIAYNTGILNSYRKYSPVKFNPETDTFAVWKPAWEMTARKVLGRRVAVCDGYAKLFKTLCDYAGLRSEVITGYARAGYGSLKFRTNHTWNAVMIDSVWRLLDVTWASGYVDLANEFVPHFSEGYFLTPPEQFFQDHYPEDPRWILMDNPPEVKEFRHAPFKPKSFIKYGITSFQPASGLIEARPGDTIRLELEFRDAGKNRTIAPDPFFDSTLLESSPFSVFLQPVIAENKAQYLFVAGKEPVSWINLMYNDDLVLRYRLKIRKDIF